MRIAFFATLGLGALMSASYATNDAPSVAPDLDLLFVLDYGQAAQ